MTIQNKTNQGRVQKVCEALDHIKKSVEANSATPQDAWELLQPAVEAMSELLGAEAQQPSNDAPAPAESPENAPKQPYKTETLREIINEAPLEDLVFYLPLVGTRIEERMEDL